MYIVTCNFIDSQKITFLHTLQDCLLLIYNNAVTAFYTILIRILWRTDLGNTEEWEKLFHSTAYPLFPYNQPHPTPNKENAHWQRNLWCTKKKNFLYLPYKCLGLSSNTEVLWFKIRLLEWIDCSPVSMLLLPSLKSSFNCRLCLFNVRVELDLLSISVDSLLSGVLVKRLFISLLVFLGVSTASNLSNRLQKYQSELNYRHISLHIYKLCLKLERKKIYSCNLRSNFCLN